MRHCVAIMLAIFPINAVKRNIHSKLQFFPFVQEIQIAHLAVENR